MWTVEKLRPGRLKGKALRTLNEEIHERDNHECIYCARHVDVGEKFHHAILKSHGGGDRLDNGVCLCFSCHIKAHGKDGKVILDYCREYLRKMYGGSP